MIIANSFRRNNVDGDPRRTYAIILLQIYFVLRCSKAIGIVLTYPSYALMMKKD